jgi:glycosyltransferase involved in cell wall biosynthesis
MNKILFISGFTPASSSAGQNYTIQLLNDLSGKVKVDLLYFKYEGQVYEPADSSINVIEAVELNAFHRIFHSITFPFFHPLFTARYSLRILFKLHKLQKTNHYDFIYFDFSQVFIYSIFFKKKRKVLMCHDVIFQKYSRQGWPLEKWWVYFSEKIIFKTQNTKLLTFSSKDVSFLKTIYKKNASVVNFYLSPLIKSLPPNLESFPLTYCFFGAWNRPENSGGLDWFMKEVFPTLDKELQFLIVGPNLPGYLKKAIEKNKGIKYLGFVENPYSIISRCNALIAPVFKGAGVKVKVIESLACGTPVIGTSVAIEGIPEQVKEGLYRCDDAPGFVRAINGFEESPAIKEKLRYWFKYNYPADSSIWLDNIGRAEEGNENPDDH